MKNTPTRIETAPGALAQVTMSDGALFQVSTAASLFTTKSSEGALFCVLMSAEERPLAVFSILDAEAYASQIALLARPQGTPLS